MTEVMIALGLIAVLGLGLHRLTSGLTRQATTSAGNTVRNQDLALFFSRLSTEAKLARQFDWPPLRVDSDWLHFITPDSDVRILTEGNKLLRRNGFSDKEVLKGFTKIRFQRPETALLEVELTFDDETFHSKIFLESLP